jgi:hypothetical protein
MYATNKSLGLGRGFQSGHGTDISTADKGTFPFPGQHRCAQIIAPRQITQGRNGLIQQHRVQRIQLGIMRDCQPRHTPRIYRNVKFSTHARFPAAKPAICA